MFLRNKKEKRRALVLWYSVDLNYGDYLIFQTVKGYLESWDFVVEAMDVGLSYKIIAKKARQCNILWFAGGGIIERGIPDIIQNFPDFYKKADQVRYGITGLSIGEFDYSAHKKEIACWVNNAAFFYSRDSYTALELNRMSESEKVIDGVDVVFANSDLNNCRVTDDGRVGINLRNLPYVDLSGEFAYAEWNQALNQVFSSNMVGIPDQLDCLNRLDVPVEGEYCPDKVTEILQNISFTVSMRFHVILVAAVMGKGSIPITYCPKVSRLAEQLGINGLALGVHDYTKLEQVVTQYLKNKNQYRATIADNVQALQQRAGQMFKEIEHILKGDC